MAMLLFAAVVLVAMCPLTMSQTCNIEQSDRPGFTIGPISPLRDITTAEACCTSCNDHPCCVAFSWIGTGHNFAGWHNLCFLKHHVPDQKQLPEKVRPYVFSGYIDGKAVCVNETPTGEPTLPPPVQEPEPAPNYTGPISCSTSGVGRDRPGYNMYPVSPIASITTKEDCCTQCGVNPCCLAWSWVGHGHGYKGYEDICFLKWTVPDETGAPHHLLENWFYTGVITVPARAACTNTTQAPP